MNTPNPYAPPRTPVVADPVDPQLGSNILATRARRATAATLDSLIALLWSVPLWMHFKILDYVVAFQDVPTGVALEVAALGFLLFVLSNAYFLHNNGQTIGKWLLGIRIATLDGKIPDFWRIVTLRYAPIALAALIPYIGIFADTFDAVFIYRKDRRCIHDLVAGTQVLRITTSARSELRSAQRS
jgi:uncharacterized RDD family membrane protein YckC